MFYFFGLYSAQTALPAQAAIAEVASLPLGRFGGSPAAEVLPVGFGPLQLVLSLK